MTAEPVVEMRGVVKKYNALRPLRIAQLAIASGGRVALSGIDAPGAEVMLNLVTGASLPDEGEVRVFGQSTAAVANGDEWLASLDRFGIVSERAVLLEGATLTQNLALPFALEIDPVPPETVQRVELLADCSLDSAALGLLLLLYGHQSKVGAALTVHAEGAAVRRAMHLQNVDFLLQGLAGAGAAAAEPDAQVLSPR